MATTRKTARTQRAPSTHSDAPQSSLLQHSHTGPEGLQHHHEDRTPATPRQSTTWSAGSAPLQPEMHRTNPSPLVAAKNDPQLSYPPFPLSEPPTTSLPTLDKEAFNAPMEQGPAQVPINVQATSSVAKEQRKRNILKLEQQIRAAKQQIQVKVEEERKIEKERKRIEEGKGKMEQELEQEQEMKYIEDNQDYLHGMVIKLQENLQQHNIPIPFFAPPPQRRKFSSVDGPQDLEDLNRDGGSNARRRTNTTRI